MGGWLGLATVTPHPSPTSPFFKMETEDLLCPQTGLFTRLCSFLGEISSSPGWAWFAWGVGGRATPAGGPLETRGAVTLPSPAAIPCEGWAELCLAGGRGRFLCLETAEGHLSADGDRISPTLGEASRSKVGCGQLAAVPRAAPPAFLPLPGATILDHPQSKMAAVAATLGDRKLGRHCLRPLLCQSPCPCLCPTTSPTFHIFFCGWQCHRL